MPKREWKRRKDKSWELNTNLPLLRISQWIWSCHWQSICNKRISLSFRTRRLEYFRTIQLVQTFSLAFPNEAYPCTHRIYIENIHTIFNYVSFHFPHRFHTLHQSYRCIIACSVIVPLLFSHLGCVLWALVFSSSSSSSSSYIVNFYLFSVPFNCAGSFFIGEICSHVFGI